MRRRQTSKGTYMSSKRESLLSIYTGLMLHAKTRKKGLIENV